MKKCVCVAYETLRASHEDFFKKREVEIGESSLNVEEEEDETGDCSMKRRREKVLEEARRSLPEYGKATEDKKIKKALKWGLPGMMSLQQQQPKCPEETETDQVTWTSSFSPSDLVLNSYQSGNRTTSCLSFFIMGQQQSLDSSASMGSRISKKKQERGRMKEEELAKKLQEMTMEEEKMRIPKAQVTKNKKLLQKTLVKPYVKDITIPVELKLHSDIRAKERAEFDYQVAEKKSLIEQDKAERVRQQKVAEEEELRRLRKELIPKAQPMPYFDRPFVPEGRASTRRYLEIPSFTKLNTRDAAVHRLGVKQDLT
ncbi:TPX2 (targeting protein for Xklp2) protein family [Raphanus sativus]|nr:TPX2 (targeting protein for Xklp2) protein family [Raphanus sativus]